jgi:NAD(P)-dependent dehydrogenase (short-subunit alcohol dehydrogenase family)
MRFAGKVALVTGGGGGIGRAVVHALVNEGARVAVMDHDHQAAAAVVAELTEGSVFAVDADVSREDQVEDAVKAALDRFGTIDLLHNQAGILPVADGPIFDVSVEQFRATLEVNVVGQFNVARAVSRHMRARGSGVIVNTASDLSMIALPGICSYVTSKTAILGLTRSMATDLAPFGIRVNAVCPGFVSTGMTAGMERDEALMSEMRKTYLMPKLGKPADIAGVVSFLLSDDSRYMTGAIVVVDGGHIVT